MDDSTIRRINELCKKYHKIYGKEIDLKIIPKGLSQEKLEKCNKKIFRKKSYKKMKAGIYPLFYFKT